MSPARETMQFAALKLGVSHTDSEGYGMHIWFSFSQVQKLSQLAKPPGSCEELHGSFRPFQALPQTWVIKKKSSDMKASEFEIRSFELELRSFELELRSFELELKETGTEK